MSKRQEQPAVFDITPYENLANAIILQAARDYRKALKGLKKYPRSKQHREEAEKLERFFQSDWYQTLTDVDGEMLIRKLQEGGGA